MRLQSVVLHWSCFFACDSLFSHAVQTYFRRYGEGKATACKHCILDHTTSMSPGAVATTPNMLKISSSCFRTPATRTVTNTLCRPRNPQHRLSKGLDSTPHHAYGVHSAGTAVAYYVITFSCRGSKVWNCRGGPWAWTS